MKISELESMLTSLKNKYGDIDVACMTAPFRDGETEILTDNLISVSSNKADNNYGKQTDKTVYIGIDAI